VRVEHLEADHELLEYPRCLYGVERDVSQNSPEELDESWFDFGGDELYPLVDLGTLMYVLPTITTNNTRKVQYSG
jgi:hypothetical protein